MSTLYSCNEIRTLIKQGGQLVDVRSPFEYRRGALSGAVNIPVPEIKQHCEVLDPFRPVLVYCRSGMRSALAKQFLELIGFDEVHNIGRYQAYAGC